MDNHHPLDLNVSSPLHDRVADPGLNAEWSITVPANNIWRINCINFLFTASGAPANRHVRITITDTNGYIRWTHPTPFLVIANATLLLTYQIGASQALTPGSTLQFNISLPDFLRLSPGWVIATETLNLQGADAYSNITLSYDNWIDLPRLT